MPRRVCRVIAFLLCFLLAFEQSGFAQAAGQLNLAGHLSQMHQQITQDKFRPLHLRYLAYDQPSRSFQLLLDKEKLSTVADAQLETTTKALFDYFLVGVALPNEKFWVNLRPDSPDAIIDPELAQTDVGRILLEADLELKKDTARFTSPQTPEGKEYWDQLYRKAEELYGSSQVTIPTLTRPWIVPDEIIVRETAGAISNTDGSHSALPSAYIYKATLKACLEQDRLQGSALYNFADPKQQALNEYSSQLIRQLIIPKLNQELNTAKRYAALRQVYYSLVMR